MWQIFQYIADMKQFNNLARTRFHYGDLSYLNYGSRRHKCPTPPIEIDRKNLTIMGVNFNSVNNFEAAVNALGTVMFEGFDPTPRSIEIIRDYLSEKITIGQLVKLTKEKAYA